LGTTERGSGSRYEKLPRGARGGNGLSSDQVMAHQRARVYQAMVEVIAAEGYGATSVKSVCALAGVSRRTFYDLFGTSRRNPKEACFLAALDFMVARAVERIKLAYRHEPDPQRRLCRAFEQFARELENEPGMARVALVEALGAGPAALAGIERARRMFEQMISASMVDRSSGATLPPSVARGIVGGVERVAGVHLLSGSIENFRAAAEELSRWARSYDPRSASVLAASSIAVPPTRRQPRRGECRNDGLRILRAAAAIAAAEGYAHLSATRISRLAGVSEADFARLYDGAGAIEECFLSALDLTGLEALVCVANASRERCGWSDGVRRGIVALMDRLATDRILARIAFVEVFSVWPAAIEQRSRLLRRFTELLRRGIPDSQRPSTLQAEAIVGAIWGLVHHHIVRGELGQLPGLADDATYLALAPVIGHAPAVEVILRGRA
jgi:AcrR family transcriptional regulator